MGFCGKTQRPLSALEKHKLQIATMLSSSATVRKTKQLCALSMKTDREIKSVGKMRKYNATLLKIHNLQ